jgi:glutamate/tyrosine decarboxylase-like PLP-dependent enzyme
VALAADWLTSAWDQNAGIHAASPALAVAHKVAAGWVRDLLGLPADCGVGIVTGCQMAHFTCLAAARHAVLRDAGWDVEAHGLQGAPDLRVIASEQIHVTVPVACRMLGLGAERVRLVPTDDQGRMVAAELETALAGHAGPTIVCAQAGEINTGAFDPLADIVELCRARGAWCHIDGAFGLWAALSPRRRGLLRGFERAHSWATDGHKWLNVPYDCGIALVADSSAHRAAMTSTSAYIPAHEQDIPWGLDWSPEFSKRARGVPLYAALRALGRTGLAELIDGCCDHAEQIASRLAEEPPRRPPSRAPARPARRGPARGVPRARRSAAACRATREATRPCRPAA